jgi:hypothetical protein
MATNRGFSVNGTSFPVTSVNVTNARNPITEVTMGSVGSPKIYGGTYSASGSIEMPFRKTPCGTLITNLFGGSIASGIVDLPSSGQWLTNVIVSDENGFGMTFASGLVTSMDLSMQAKEMCKCTFNFLGIKGTTGSVGSSPDYTTDTIPIFYNSILTVGSATAQAFGVTIHVERPIDTDYYVLGSPFLQDAVQSGAVVLSGSLTLAPKESAILTNAINSVSTDSIAPLSTNKDSIDLGTGETPEASLVLQLNKHDGTSTIQTITIDIIKLSDWSMSANGREKFAKTINWLGIIDSTTSNIKFT